MGIESFQDTKWQDFIKDCKKQVENDNNDKELNINSVFLPNPEICHKPEYCLIAMEPRDSNLAILEDNINGGYKNFIEGYEELIIHYCAYHYLGKPGFNYYITDLIKGSMTSDDAERSREILRPRWHPLLEKEMDLLGNPIRIAVGVGVYDYINGTTLKAKDYILHYSDANRGSRTSEYNHLNKVAPPLLDSEIDEKKIREFVSDFIRHLGYRRHDRVTRILGEGVRLSEARKKYIYALYRHNFESLTKNGKIVHSQR